MRRINILVDAVTESSGETMAKVRDLPWERPDFPTPLEVARRERPRHDDEPTPILATFRR